MNLWNTGEKTARTERNWGSLRLPFKFSRAWTKCVRIPGLVRRSLASEYRAYDQRCPELFLSCSKQAPDWAWRGAEMSCAHSGECGRIQAICFECYRRHRESGGLDASTKAGHRRRESLPSGLTSRQIAHRQRMLDFAEAGGARAASR